VSVVECETIALPDRYQDLGLIGLGGMGEVRRVRDLTFGRVLALKTMHARWLRFPAAVSRIVAEAQLTAQLQHPGIASVHDMGHLPDGRFYFTMREVGGSHLGAWIGDVPPPESKRRVLLEVLLAASKTMAYAHSRGVVHRDLKPENILIGDFGEVVVIDWGLARVVAATAGEQVITVRSENPRLRTQIGHIGGTRGFMPPEQEQGLVDAVGPWTDTWALGAILQVILIGYEPVVPLAEAFAVPGRLRQIAGRAMSTAVADRYPTAAAFAADLAACLADEVGSLPRAEELVRRARRARDAAGQMQATASVLRASDASALEVELASERARLLAAEALRLASAALACCSDHPDAEGIVGWAMGIIAGRGTREAMSPGGNRHVTAAPPATEVQGRLLTLPADSFDGPDSG
jgi:serine/threonine-protein kinase